MKQSIWALVFFLTFAGHAAAQIGGQGVYSFLKLKSPAQIAALGGELPAKQSRDIGLTYDNPALLNPDMDKHLSFSYIPYFADIRYGYAGGAFSLNNTSRIAAGIHYVNYGDFIRADVNGVRQGKFSAAEYAIQLSYNRTLIDSVLYAGVSVKPILSELERYSSYGLSTDWGLLFTTPNKLTALSLTARNVGMQLTSYYGNHRESLPLNILFGFSQKLAYAPFRFHVTLHHLNDWSIASDFLEEETTGALGEEAYEKARWEEILNEGMHHLVVGTEISFFQALTINVGYNHQRRMEMAIPEVKGFHGFSFGFDIKLNRFLISYGRAAYHAAGASNHFSVTADLGGFISPEKAKDR